MTEETLERPEGWYDPSDADFERVYTGEDLHGALKDFLGEKRRIIRNTPIGTLVFKKAEGDWLTMSDESWRPGFLVSFVNPNESIEHSEHEIGISPSGQLTHRRTDENSKKPFQKLGGRDAFAYTQVVYPEVEYFIENAHKLP